MNGLSGASRCASRRRLGPSMATVDGICVLHEPCGRLRRPTAHAAGWCHLRTVDFCARAAPKNVVAPNFWPQQK